MDLGADNVVFCEDVLLVLDWTRAGSRPANRELVGSARARDSLVEDKQGKKLSLVITKDKMYLLSASSARIRNKLDRT